VAKHPLPTPATVSTRLDIFLCHFLRDRDFRRDVSLVRGDLVMGRWWTQRSTWCPTEFIFVGRRYILYMMSVKVLQIVLPIISL